MDYVAMVGKLASWWLVGENRRGGFLLGALSSLLMAVPVTEAGLYGFTVYCFILTVIQVRAYFRCDNKT